MRSCVVRVKGQGTCSLRDGASGGDAHLGVNWLDGAFVWAVTTGKEATIYSARNRRRTAR
jgi:hypothetical protein